MFSGSFKAIISGVLVTVMLMTMLAVTRLFKVESTVEKIEIVEISAVLPMEEEPPLEESEQPEKDSELEAINLDTLVPALEMADAPDVKMLEIPVSALKVTPTMSVDLMSLDRAPALLPVKKIARAKYKPTSRPSSKPSKKPSKVTSKPRVTPPKLKAYYGPSELDGIPRVTRQGSYTWPRRAKGKSGVVKLKIEISSSGRVSVISVISSTDASLTDAAKKLARSSRYTAPRKNGKPTKARFTKTYQLIKPR